MKKSDKTIIEHIPDFLDYCENEKKLTTTTQRTYKRYLNSFISYLNNNNKENIRPHELTAEDIWDYRLFLSRNVTYRGKPLKKISQNYYLIALRALLSYFTVKDIVSLPVNKISLPKLSNREKPHFLTTEQIRVIVNSRKATSPIELRNRAILSLLMSSGMKVSKLVNLNRDKINEIICSEEALINVNEYLKTRTDKEKALFINYKGPKNADKRLSVRSVENIVKKYQKKAGDSFLITPEILRWSSIRAFAHKQDSGPEEIKTLHHHQNFSVKKYIYHQKDKNLFQYPKRNRDIRWHTVESLINKETDWLKKNLSVMPERYRSGHSLFSDEYLIRKIAILVVSGKVQASEVTTKENLWFNSKNGFTHDSLTSHGKFWHRKMMETVYNYFSSQKYKVEVEPQLKLGRADLGVYSEAEGPLFIEIGSVSPLKIWYNLSRKNDINFLLVPHNEYIIELFKEKL